jgi:pyruvate dehydrogenase E2 component (dihydrolipoamide acetyltransferase)
LADVVLPSLGESVTEGIITRWMKRVGDSVARDEPLFEISTDKVDSEMPSPAAGVLLAIHAQEGDTVAVGAVVAVIGDSDGAVASPAPGAATPAPAVASPTAVTPAASPTGTPSGMVVSPVVRRILESGEVDARTVTGTGPGGAITRRDAERAVANGPTEDVPTPLSPARRRMAQHMVESVRTSPQGFVAVEVDASSFADSGALSSGLASPTVVVAVAAVRALGEFPFLNASIVGDELILHRSVNLGVVTSMQPDGMLVPVVHAAAGLTVRAMALRLADLAERVSNRTLMTDDLMGGTFTIQPAPTDSTLVGVPLLIQPEVASLFVGAVRAEPVVANGTVVVGHRVTLGLSFDHRVADPTAAALYLERVGQLLAGIDLRSEL